jgi:hypothetical protein
MSTEKITDKYANSQLNESDTRCPLWRFVTKLDKASGGGGNINFKCNYFMDVIELLCYLFVFSSVLLLLLNFAT